MATRRSVLAGLAASALAPSASWSAIGNPAYVSAARDAAGAFWLGGLSDAGDLLFKVPLPDRGHAAAAHPVRAEVVAFARRPGTFALVLDLAASGRVLAELEAPDGRHFYGHGAFSRSGETLFTTENDYDAARGVIGIWDAARGYKRLGEISSGGVGPHDILRLPGSDALVVANGGIETHPETGRTKLNLPMMAPNLTYLGPDGQILESVDMPVDIRMNSIRHLAARSDGLVAAAMQWQGNPADAPPLLMLHSRGDPPRIAEAPDDAQLAMQGYAGSVAYAGDGRSVGITSPRGGQALVFRTNGAFAGAFAAADICGMAGSDDGLMATTGAGHILWLEGRRPAKAHNLSWDNHIVAVDRTQMNEG